MNRKLLSKLLVLAMALSMVTTSAFAAFDDAKGHWGEDSINRWGSYGVITGDDQGNSNPDGEMTRAEAAALFARLLGLTELGDISQYNDVDPDSWYAEAIAKCVAAGILNGTGNGMEPNGKLTREQFFVMFARALGIAPTETSEKTFNDAGDISSWAQGYINALVNMGAVSGVDDNKIAPTLNINRASVAALLDKSISTYVNEPGTVEVSGDGIILVVSDNVKLTGETSGTIVITSSNANVDLKGVSGDVTIVVAADDVELTNVPAGVTVTVSEGATGVTSNGSSLAGGSSTATTAPSGGSSGGGGGSGSGGGSGDSGSTPPAGGGDNPEQGTVNKPTITVGDREYQYDPNENGYFLVDELEEREYVSFDQILSDAKESGSMILVDGKEYQYDNEEREWFDQDENQKTDEEVFGGSNTADPVA